MINERLAELLARKLSGEANAAEIQELEVWLQGNPADQYFSDILLTYWNTHPDNSSINTESDQHFAHILEMAEEDSENRMPAGLSAGYKKMIFVRRVQKIAIAAGLAGIITLSAWFFINNSRNKIPDQVLAQNEPPKNEVVAKRGARTQLVLPDGTQVKLNSDSKLQYEASFNDTIREVTLEGEAYFNVVKDPKRPFIVHTSGIDIRVLGTAFNVKSYPLEPTIETTLIHGKVEIINKKESKASRFYLKPHEKLVFNKEENAFKADKPAQVGPVSSYINHGFKIESLKNIPDTSLIETSWVYNKLVFNGQETFREMAVKMERWYNVQILVNNENLAKQKIVFTINDETIAQALDALKIIYPFKYKQENNVITIQ